MASADALHRCFFFFAKWA